MDKSQRDKQVIFQVVVVSIAVLKYQINVQITGPIGDLQFELSSFCILNLCYYVESINRFIQQILFNIHTMFDKELSQNKLKEKMSSQSVFKSNLQVDQIFIFQMKYENQDQIYKNQFDNTQQPCVVKLEIKEMKKTEVQLNKGAYRLHAQVVRVIPDEKDKENCQYQVIGGADVVSAGKYVNQLIYDEITCLDKNFQNQVSMNLNMTKKRMNHRVCMIDENRVLIVGGYNEEEHTLAHCEQVVLEKESMISINLNIGYNEQKDEESEVAKMFPEQVPSMNEPRQNFGISVMKNNKDKLKDPSQYLKVVVCGGWDGRHQLNSVEILDFKNNKWEIQHCCSSCIIPCSNLAVMAFIDLDTGDKESKNELLVIFGGQTYNSFLDENKTNDTRDNYEEEDLQSSRENWQNLEMKEEEDPELLSIADRNQLEFQRQKQEPKLFPDNPIEMLQNEPPSKTRTMYFECMNNQYRNLLICYDERPLDSGNQKFIFGIKQVVENGLQFQLEEINAERHFYLIKLDIESDPPIQLKQSNKSVQFCKGEVNKKNRDQIWVVNEVENQIKSAKGQQICQDNQEIKLVNEVNEQTSISIDEKEDKLVRLDVTEILDLTTMVAQNDNNIKNNFQRKNMIIDSPELNFLTDQILSGTCLQVGRDIMFFASADQFGQYNTTNNSWNFTMKHHHEGMYQGGSIVQWFDDDQE